MKLRPNLVIVFAVTYICLLGVLFATTTTVLLEGYEEIEKADIQHYMDMGLSALHRRISDLDFINHGYAADDETYSFMQDQETQHISKMLLDTTFVEAEISLMLFVDNANEVLYGKAFDLVEEEETTMPDGVYQHIHQNSALTNHQGADSGISGIMKIPEGLILVTSRPILTSRKEGPAQGALIIARYLDSMEINKLGNIASLSLEIVDIDEADEKIDFRSALSKISEDDQMAINKLHPNIIAGYSIVDDIYGDPVLVFKTDTPRAIYKLGRTSVWYFLISLVLVGVAVGIFAMLAMDRLVISRLTKLEEEVSNIDPNTLELVKVESSGDDEVSSLASSINGMLYALRRYRSLLRERERMAAIGEIAAMVGHDLRNPLQVIVGSHNFIKRKLKSAEPETGSSYNDEIEEWLEKIEAQTSYMNKIVSDLQDYSRSIKPAPEEADITLLLKDVTSSVQTPHDIDISFEFDEELPVISVDTTLMRRLFTNLILNAVQAMPEGGSLSIRGSVQGDEVVISVEDTGIGISEENIDKIFKPLFTSKAKGTGFGLPVSKRIVDAHGGTISIESKEGIGTTFTVKLPVAYVHMDSENNIASEAELADIQTDTTAS